MDRIDKIRTKEEAARMKRLAEEAIRLHKSRGNDDLVQMFFQRINKIEANAKFHK